MNPEHEMNVEVHTTRYVNDNNWVETASTGSATVTCSCGFDSGAVSRDDVQRIWDEHQAQTAR